MSWNIPIVQEKPYLILQNEMATSKVLPYIFIVVLGIIKIATQVNAECCREKVQLAHECLDGSHRYCGSLICFDGTISNGGFCGNGQCSIFGCDCDDGCRRNSFGFDRNEAKKLFEEKHNISARFTSPDPIQN